MEKMKVTYPISSQIPENSDANGTFLVRSIMASIGGASIPAIIFYFLM